MGRVHFMYPFLSGGLLGCYHVWLLWIMLPWTHMCDSLLFAQTLPCTVSPNTSPSPCSLSPEHLSLCCFSGCQGSERQALKASLHPQLTPHPHPSPSRLTTKSPHQSLRERRWRSWWPCRSQCFHIFFYIFLFTHPNMQPRKMGCLCVRASTFHLVTCFLFLNAASQCSITLVHTDAPNYF